MRFFCRENDLCDSSGKFLRVSCHPETSDFLGLWVVWSTPFEGEQNCWSGSTFRCFCQIFRQILADSQQYLCGLAPYVTTFFYLYLRNKSKQIHSVFWLPRAISGHTCCPPESLPESNSHQSSPEHLLPWFPPKYHKEKNYRNTGITEGTDSSMISHNWYDWYLRALLKFYMQKHTNWQQNCI